MTWTNIAKPNTSNYTKLPKPTGGGTLQRGSAMGPLGLTRSDTTILSVYSKLAKPTNNSWVNISKPI